MSGSASERAFSHVAFSLHVWRDWALQQREYGWPICSTEVQVQHRARTATRVDGIAAYHGRVAVGDGEKTVPRDPPDMPKETRPSRRPSVPDIDRARLGPAIDRYLGELSEISMDHATVLRAHYLGAHFSAQERADQIGMSLRRYWELHRGAMMWMAGRMRPRDWDA